MHRSSALKNSPLGQYCPYISKYDPNLIFPIVRKIKREEAAIFEPLPFYGNDIWNAYECSWLNPQGKPMVAIGTFSIPCDSEQLIESKSMKLYLHSFNNTVFDTIDHVKNTIKQDLSAATKALIDVQLFLPHEFPMTPLQTFSGICLDSLNVTIHDYQINPKLLFTLPGQTNETVYSNLLKSNCLMTGQPDWASVQITYQGPKIDHVSLLSYLVSYRNHSDLHEQCVEQIFMDIMKFCQPQELTVIAKYTRRGGIDISPIRSTKKVCVFPNFRDIRQ